jgi:hypothetical protein
MEETNYSRQPSTEQESGQSGLQTPDSEQAEKAPDTNEKTKNAMLPSDTEEGVGVAEVSKKSYLQKLRLFVPGAFSKKNEIAGMVRRPLIYLSFPVIAYSGFCYGSNLVSTMTYTSKHVLTSRVGLV